MVYLSPRFILLTALVATAAMPSFMLQADARAIGLVERHHDKSSHHQTHHTSSIASKGKSKVEDKPTLPLPLSAKGRFATSKKHGKGGRKHKEMERRALRNGEWDHFDPLSASSTHHLLSNIMQREESQATFSLHKRSRIYGKREREIAEIEKEEMMDEARAKAAEAATRNDTWDQFDPRLKVGKYEIGNARQGMTSEKYNLLPRSPEPHHHRHHHHHDKVIVNGDHDDVHIHERRTTLGGELDHHELATNKRGTNHGSEGAKVVMHTNQPRSPHHHHHHHHNEHDKIVVNGDDDRVHVHERRDHHHHDHRGNTDSGDFSSGQQKRSEVLDDQSPGVPGTIDIMAVGGSNRQKLASLILSSAPGGGSTSANGTKSTSDDDSPFVLDASNTTQTQFFLAANTPPGVSAPSTPSSTLANTLSILKAATSAKSDDSGSADVQVQLRVLIFEPTEAAMKPYCATYDPSPPAPAPLYMKRCFSDKVSDLENAGKMAELSLHQSQTFAYNPNTGTVRPRWFSVSDGPTENSSAAGLNDLNNATANREEKQMNFKIPLSNKYAPEHVPGQVSVIGDVTQTLNGTVNGTVTSPSQVSDAQNVVLVFTPMAPAVHVVNSAPDDDASDSGSDSSVDDGPGDNTEDGSFSSSMTASSASASASETTSDNASTSTNEPGPSGLPAEKVDATSDATDIYGESVSATATDSASTSISTSGTDTSMESTSSSISDSGLSSDSSASVPTDSPAYMIDEDAIEKMYQQEPRIR